MDYTDLLALLICVSFSGYMLKCVIEGLNNPEDHAFSDKFDIGYYSEKTTTITPVELEVNVKPKKPTGPVISAEKEAIFKNCVLALRSLGYNKKEAKEQVTKFFENNNPKDVEDFLQDYMSKCREDKNAQE